MAGTNVSDKIDDSIFRLHVTLNRILSTTLLYSHILFFFENKSALYKNEEIAHNSSENIRISIPSFFLSPFCSPKPQYQTTVNKTSPALLAFSLTAWVSLLVLSTLPVACRYIFNKATFNKWCLLRPSD
jgi:hypothetical protein